jgi:hypothetical protein
VTPRCDAVSTNQNAWARLDVPPELAEVERENLQLHRELQDTKLGLTNAIRYALLVHSQELAVGPAGCPRPAPEASRASTEREDPRELGGQRTQRLQEELTQARAERDQLRRLLNAVLEHDGHGGADPKAKLSSRFSAGANLRGSR